MASNQISAGSINLEKRALYVIIAGFAIQLITAITQVGYLHPDQHFQYIEFAMQLLGMESYAPEIWEYNEKIRPTLGVYLIAVLYKVYAFAGLDDPFFFHSFLRLCTALGGFILFNHLVIRLIGPKNRDVLFYSLILLNLGWCYPFVRTLLGSEVWGGMMFFTGYIVYLDSDQKREQLNLFVAGFLLSLSFFFRFQMGFAILAMFLWIFFYEKNQFRKLLLLGIGFTLGFAFNVALDTSYYGEFVLTPVRYFTVNIIDGVAAQFGTSPPSYYFVELLIVLFAPLLSIFLFYYLFFGSWKRRTDILVWIFVLFLIGHSIVGHKEERFLFPVFGLLPVLIGYAMLDTPKMITFLKTSKFIRLFVLPVTLTLNVIAIVALMFVSYSQTIGFSEKLSSGFNTENVAVQIYYLDRSPFETPSRLIHHFYLNQLDDNIHLTRIESIAELKQLNSENAFFCGTYNMIEEDESAGEFKVDDLEVVFKSSNLLWSVNDFLKSKGTNTINDIWVMVKL